MLNAKNFKMFDGNALTKKKKKKELDLLVALSKYKLIEV